MGVSLVAAGPVVFLVSCAVSSCAIVPGDEAEGERPEPPADPEDFAFSAGELDPERWVTTLAGDFKERIVDVVGKNGPESRLRIRANTMGTHPKTVKFLGARTVRSFSLAGEVRITVELDWNGQKNGSYMTAGVVLCPSATTGNPLKERDWLKVEYVGVPPGRNARMVVGTSKAGRELTLYTEGWPQKNRKGRSISVQTITIVIRDGSFQVFENGELRYDSNGVRLSFDSAHVYLQMSSHSNYRAREVYFDNLRVLSKR